MSFTTFFILVSVLSTSFASSPDCVPSQELFYWKVPCDSQTFPNRFLVSNVTVTQNGKSTDSQGGFDLSTDLDLVLNVNGQHGPIEKPSIGVRVYEYAKSSDKCEWIKVATTSVIHETNEYKIDKKRDTCLDNGAACSPDGSMGTCCSGFCYKRKVSGQEPCQGFQGSCRGPCPDPCQGRCQDRLKRGLTCLDNGASCHVDGSMGNCCSSFCFAQWGQQAGTCQNRQRRNTCLPAGFSCLSDASKGKCCGSCVLIQGSPPVGLPDNQPASGYCLTARRKKRSTCLDNRSFCRTDGSMGKCCSGFCLAGEGQTGLCGDLSQKWDFDSINNSTRLTTAVNIKDLVGLMYDNINVNKFYGLTISFNDGNTGFQCVYIQDLVIKK